MFHDSSLNLTQQHEIGTTGAQEASRAAPKPCSPSETAPNCKVLVNQNKMNTRGLCERERSCFHPRSQWNKDSGLVVKLLHMPLSLFALWGRCFVWQQGSSCCSCTVFGSRRGAGLALCASSHFLNGAGLFLSVHLLEVVPLSPKQQGWHHLPLVSFTNSAGYSLSLSDFMAILYQCSPGFPFFTCRSCLQDGNWHENSYQLNY